MNQVDFLNKLYCAFTPQQLLDEIVDVLGNHELAAVFEYITDMHGLDDDGNLKT